jgi:hypothetical protein
MLAQNQQQGQQQDQQQTQTGAEASPDQQQVQSAFPQKKIKAAGTPKQALPAQEPGDAITDEDQATPEQRDELMDVMHVDDAMDNLLALLPVVIEQQQKNLIQSYEPQLARLTAAQKEQVAKLNKKYLEKADDLYPSDEMVKQISKLYQNRLNNGDVESAINFFSSDAGQHLLGAQPEIMKVFLPAVLAEVKKRTEALREAEKKELEALLASFKPVKK